MQKISDESLGCGRVAPTCSFHEICLANLGYPSVILIKYMTPTKKCV